MPKTQGFVIDASEVEGLAEELKRNADQILGEVRKETVAAGRKIQRRARELAKSDSFPSLAGSIYTSTKQTAHGVEVTVEAKSPFGYIREFGAGRSGPHPFMLPALEGALPGWEQALSDALGRTL